MISVVWLGDKEKMERHSQEIFKENTTIIAGHTPTIADSVFFTGGTVFKYENKEKNILHLGLLQCLISNLITVDGSSARRHCTQISQIFSVFDGL